jgi:hypothetical protein
MSKNSRADEIPVMYTLVHVVAKIKPIKPEEISCLQLRQAGNAH